MVLLLVLLGRGSRTVRAIIDDDALPRRSPMLVERSIGIVLHHKRLSVYFVTLGNIPRR